MITSVAVSEIDRFGKIFLPEMIIASVQARQIFACGQGRGRISSFRASGYGHR
jgi:hypothetical protein